MSPIISFKSVSKQFKLQDERPRSFQAHLVELFKPHKKSTGRLDVLKDISFDLNKGETLGIVGVNGAGKSTLLKLAAQIIKPDRGQIIRQGRITGLLELGAGFHSDLSGRENIYLNGSILGLTRQEVDQKLAKIVDFSGLPGFIDVPVRNYSSGMLVRLGFAIAAHVEADALLIDEALSVGDARFQLKSTQYLKAYKKNGGSSILVSHDIKSLRHLCDRLLLIHNGQCIGDGETETILDQYFSLIDEELLSEQVKPINNSKPTLEVEIMNVELADIDRQPKRIFESGEPVRLKFNYRTNQPIESPVFQVQILATGPMYPGSGIVVHGTNTARHHLKTGTIKGEGCVSICYPSLNLLEGDYAFRVGIMPNDKEPRYYALLQHVCSFKIQSEFHPGSGITLLEHEWNVKKE